MGQSVLKIHKVDGSRFAPYGYFGLFDGHLALPVEDPFYLETFSTHFALGRIGKQGLSVLIPYPDKEINLRGCANSVIRHYFFPILARWAIQQPKEKFIQLKEPQPGKRPKLTEDLFGSEQLDSIRRDFVEGGRLAFHVPVTVLKQSDSKISHTGFSVFLERDEKLDKPEDHFIRQGITIPEVSSLKHKGIRAIVSVTESYLSAF